MDSAHLVHPDWPAPANVRAFSTTRRGGVSQGPYESLNLSLACGDAREDVLANRRLLATGLPSQPLWLRQVHGNRVLGSEAGPESPQGDARVSSIPGKVLAVLSADCLPVLLCDDKGGSVGIAHAGWRGLAGGVIEATVARMGTEPGRLLAWLGPAISGDAYQVGGEVRDALSASPTLKHAGVGRAFRPDGNRWRLDLAEAARLILAELGIENVFGGGFCTFADPGRFFSYRRDGTTGRMASLIWLQR